MRFWAAIIAQLVLPLGFVLFGMILAVALPSLNEDDPSRTLGLSNSAASSDNVSLFYAQFAESSNSTSFNFSVSTTISGHTGEQCLTAVCIKIQYKMYVQPLEGRGSI